MVSRRTAAIAIVADFFTHAGLNIPSQEEERDCGVKKDRLLTAYGVRRPLT